jgi:nucleoside-diphosphate-sugar epimerase
MKVLITGAGGFIGKACLEVLDQAGAEIIVLGRSRPNTHHTFIAWNLLASDELLSLMNTVRPTHLLHLAWYAEHGKFWESPINFEWIAATQKLVEAFCLSGGKHAVFAGTCAEYDWTRGECIEDLTPLNPTSLYGKCKVETSQIASDLCKKHGVRFAWGRIFQPYGPFENRERLVPALIDVFQGKRKPFGINGNFIRDFVYAKDVARAFLALLDTAAKGYYNISSGKPLRLSDVATLIAQACKADANVILDLKAKNTKGPQMILGSNDRLKNLNWMAETDFQTGIHEILRA